jgi:SP family galactose:H+ symporter-like MFS transporter
MNHTSARTPFRKVYLPASLAAIGGFLFGYSTAVISGVLLILKTEWQLGEAAQGLIVSSLLFGALLGAPISGLIADRFGRRDIIMTTAAIFAMGSFAAGLAPSLPWLIVARVILGVGVGAASLCVPLYISEISPARNRGAMVSLNQLAITIGILVSYLVNAIFAEYDEGWRYVFMVGAIPAMMLGIGMLFAPGSPRWMLMEEDEEDARQIFKKLGIHDVNKTIQRLKGLLDLGKATSFSDLFQSWLRPALIAGVGIFVIQQFTGINVIIYYAPSIFEMAGFKSQAGALFATVGVGVVNVLLTLVSMRLLDLVGRKLLLSIGLTGMILSMLALGAIFLQPRHVLTDYNWLVVEILIVYIASFSVSLGTVGWLLISEIYPLRIRGVAMTVPTVTHWICNILVSLTFLSLISFLGPGTMYLVFAAIAAVGWFFVRRFVPETKGLSLEEIEAHWSEGKSATEIR